MWQFPQISLPSDGATVWIIRQPWFDKPFQVVYDATLSVWVWTDPNANANNLPLWQAWKWRPV